MIHWMDGILQQKYLPLVFRLALEHNWISGEGENVAICKSDDELLSKETKRNINGRCIE